MKNTISWRERRGVALIIVLGLALFASVVFATIFTLLRQSAAVSQNFGQRITASAWNDRILTRIAAVIAAHPWEERFYIKNPTDSPGELYTFKAGKFPFEDLEYECRVEGIRFDGAIMDVPNERKYRVKLVITCENPTATYATFSEVHYNPGLLNLANRGVRQIVMNLSPEDLDLSLNAFAASINRLSGIARDVGKTTPVPAAKTGASQQITPEHAAAAVEPPAENNISTISKEFAEFAEIMDFPDRDYLVAFCRAIEETAKKTTPREGIKYVGDNLYGFSKILLPNGQTMGEFKESIGLKIGYNIEVPAVYYTFYLLHLSLRSFPRVELYNTEHYDLVMQKTLLRSLLRVLTNTSYCLQYDTDLITTGEEGINIKGMDSSRQYLSTANPDFSIAGPKIVIDDATMDSRLEKMLKDANRAFGYYTR